MTPDDARLAGLETVLRGLARIDPSPATAESIRQRMHQEANRRRQRRAAHGGRPARRPLRVAAATSAGVVLSFLYVIDVLRRAVGYLER